MQIPKFILLSLLLLTSFCSALSNSFDSSTAKADVGVILELDTPLGKIYRTCISTAIEDFYSKHQNYTTMIVPHFRDSRTQAIAATSSAIDLLKNTQVMAIFGPQKPSQASFVIEIGNNVGVPIISPETGVSISPEESPYYIRAAWSYSSQFKVIAAIVKAFGWREVAFIYHNPKYGGGPLPFFIGSMIQVSHQSVFSSSSRDDQILKDLYSLKTMQTRVFIVHLGPKLASRFFRIAKEAGMMSGGYAWIMVDKLTNLLHLVDSEAREAMQGVIGVRAYIPRSNELKNFEKRWSKRFLAEYPKEDMLDFNVNGLWAYDSITALAEAVERVGVTSPRFKKPVDRGNLTDLETIGTSNIGPSLAPLIRNYTSRGLSGNFNVSNGQLQSYAFEIVNVIGRGEHTVGFWTERYGLSKKLKPDDADEGVYSMKKDNLGPIIWPGLTIEVPKGWEIPTSGKKLRVGVPLKGGFSEFINVERDAETGAAVATGFIIDVFEEVVKLLPYAVLFDYIPVDELDYEYDNLVRQIELQKYDAVVGDVTVTANRSEFADFTIPFTESGVATIVPIKGNERKNAWIFMKPLTTGLWLTVGAFFVFIGFVVWVLEHRVNKEFQGPPIQQVGVMFWFSFSTLVFAHREKVTSNLTRFVIIVWLFVVLVLTQSYTANLTSMLTVQQLRPTITEMSDLIKSGEYVGYQQGSFVSGLLKNMKFDQTKFKSYNPEEYDEALSKGSTNGGVAAIVDELPYIRLFLSKYCHKYTMIGPTYKTSGFGFAFSKGSPLVPDVSRAILKLKEDEKMVQISRKWLGDLERCQGDGAGNTSESLNVDSFKGLFVIAGVSSSSALAIFFFTFLYHHRYILTSTASIKEKIYGLARVFSREKDDESRTDDVVEGSPAISISCDHQDMFSQDEGFSTIELATPPTHHVTQP
ncbi:hypothetical protein ACS0TY_035533 [Phlomoides rotata]